MNNKAKILITGPIAPPAGGISVHIQRLQFILRDEFEIDLIDESDIRKEGIFNMRSLNLLVYLKKVSRTQLLFVQGGNKLFKKIHIITGRLMGKKIIVTIHGYGPKRPQPFRSIDSMVFGLADKIILVNETIANRVKLPSAKTIVKHAFLPPLMAEEPALPAELLHFISKAKNENSVLVCANASRLDRHNGQDLYGLDMTIDVARRLISAHESVKFIYVVSSTDTGREPFEQAVALLNEYGLSEHFLLLNERLSFVKLVEQCDIVLRPTNADGDALTVREALYLGKTIIASDVVERPVGTVLFKTRDLNDMHVKLSEIIKSYKNGQQRVHSTKEDAPEDFKGFYTKLIRSTILQ